jgi:hypothetical protein
MNTAIRRTSSLAIISLVSGLLGWTLAPWLGSIIAIVTGHMARSEIRKQPDEIDGDGFAIAGLVMGYLFISLTILTVLAVVLFFGGLAALAAFAASVGN